MRETGVMGKDLIIFKRYPNRVLDFLVRAADP